MLNKIKEAVFECFRISLNPKLWLVPTWRLPFFSGLEWGRSYFPRMQFCLWYLSCIHILPGSASGPVSAVVSTACKSQMTLGKEAAGHIPSLV